MSPYRTAYKEEKIEEVVITFKDKFKCWLYGHDLKLTIHHTNFINHILNDQIALKYRKIYFELNTSVCCTRCKEYFKCIGTTLLQPSSNIETSMKISELIDEEYKIILNQL